MALSVTALQLVNRVARRMRWNTVSDVTSEQGAALLDAVNNAIHHVLNGHDWDFDVRHDGIVKTTPFVSFDDAILTIDSSTVTSADLKSYSQSTAFQSNTISRLVFTNHATHSNTSYRVVSSQDTGTGSFTLETTWPGASATAITGKLFSAEHLLPTTVRKVIKVIHEGSPLTLRSIDPTIRFDELVPRHFEASGNPEWVGVGGYDISTYQTGSTAPDPRLRLIAWPISSQVEVLRYSYYYEHPELAAATDTLVGVPDGIVADIVEMAQSDAMTSLERDPQTGKLLAQISAGRSYQKRQNSDPDAGRRRTARSWASHEMSSRHSSWFNDPISQ